MPRRPNPQSSLFEDFTPEYCYDLEEDTTTRIAKFFIERHKIFLRRNLLNREAPWTKDPILANYRFCNIYRELDTVSQWINNNVIKPNEDNPNLPILLGLSRIINWPDTLQQLMDDEVWPERSFNKERFYRSLERRKLSGKKVVTGAYIVNSIFPKDYHPKDSSKIGYVAEITATNLWKNRMELSRAGKSSLKEFVNTLGKLHGWGSFRSYQVVVDLTYSKKWLGTAHDLNTFNSPGPGTQRGLNRYFTGSKKLTLPKKDLGPLIVQLRDEVNRKLRELVPKEWMTGNMKTGFQELTLSNVSNLCCEWDKMERVRNGEGGMKNSYNPPKKN